MAFALDPWSFLVNISPEWYLFPPDWWWVDVVGLLERERGCQTFLFLSPPQLLTLRATNINWLNIILWGSSFLPCFGADCRCRRFASTNQIRVRRVVSRWRAQPLTTILSDRVSARRTPMEGNSPPPTGSLHPASRWKNGGKWSQNIAYISTHN